MKGSFFSGGSLILITDDMERIVLPSSMMCALRRARDFGRRAGNLSSDHPLNVVIENAITLPGAVSLAPSPHERPQALFADVEAKDGTVGGSTNCPICLNDWAKDDDIVLSRCAHAFHRECIRAWVQPQDSSKGVNRDTCPLCRAQL